MLFRYTIKLLLVSSLLELIFNRIVSRLGMHMPKEALKNMLVVEAMKGLSLFGFFTLNISMILTLLALFLIIRDGYRPSGLRPYIPAPDKFIQWSVILLILLSIFSIFLGSSPGLSIIYTLLFIVAIGIITYLILINTNRSDERRMITSLWIASFCYNYYKVSEIISQTYGITVLSPLAGGLFRVGELMMALAIFFMFVAYSWPLSIARAWISAAIATIILFGYLGIYYIDPSILPILGIWSLGYTSYLPMIVYALILWMLSFTLLKGLWEDMVAAYALAYIYISGYAMQLSYQYLLAFFGFLLFLYEMKQKFPSPFSSPLRGEGSPEGG